MRYKPDTFPLNVPITVSYDTVDNNGNDKVLSKVYQSNPKHRDGSRNKSQWRITLQDEVMLFGWAFENNSFDKKYYWGVIQQGDKCIELGFTTNRNIGSRIARFEHGNPPEIWHGYPVDYIRDPQNDCPGKRLLNNWRDWGIITKADIAKLISGRGWKG